MFAVHVTLQVRHECEQEFLAAITTAARTAVRDEPGCLIFDVTQLDDEGRYAFFELYTDEEAVRIGHRGSEHFRAWRRVADRVLVPGSQTALTGTAVVTAHDLALLGANR